jgi:hypothetical protein
MRAAWKRVLREAAVTPNTKRTQLLRKDSPYRSGRSPD